jgi:hypothetical protein
VNAENLALNHGANPEVVEDFSAVFPRVGVSVLSDGFVIETVDSCDLSCLVVSSEESNVSGILELQAKQKLECLDRVVSTIDEVTHEYVAGIRDLATLIK